MILLLSLALAETPDAIDLDGDGTPEPVRVTEGRVFVGDHATECYPDDGCTLTEADITASNPQKDVVTCFTGPRDDVACSLWTLKDGSLEQVRFGEHPAAEAITLNGSGFLYTSDWMYRLYHRTTKYQWKDGEMVHVAQPIYTAAEPTSLHVDETFELRQAPGSSALVGNARPDSDIHILGEHGGEPGWMLVRLSSGISGWAHVDHLREASQQYRMLLSAG